MPGGTRAPAPERDLGLVESGILEASRSIEAIDGQVVASMPPGKRRNLPVLALPQAFRRIDFGDLLIAVRTTVVLREGDAHDPRELPRAEGVPWVVEASASSRRTDLDARKAGDAAAGVPAYWAVDALQRGVGVFADPVAGECGRPSSRRASRWSCPSSARPSAPARSSPCRGAARHARTSRRPPESRLSDGRAALVGTTFPGVSLRCP